jgi:hypothetical protein
MLVLSEGKALLLQPFKQALVSEPELLPKSFLGRKLCRTGVLGRIIIRPQDPASLLVSQGRLVDLFGQDVRGRLGR